MHTTILGFESIRVIDSTVQKAFFFSNSKQSMLNMCHKEINR